MDFETNESNGDSFNERPIASAFSGCIYAAFVVIISGGMLLVNAFLCLTIYAAFPKHESVEVSSRVGQMFFFVAPVALLVVEWNLIDRVQRLFQREL